MRKIDLARQGRRKILCTSKGALLPIRLFQDAVKEILIFWQHHDFEYARHEGLTAGPFPGHQSTPGNLSNEAASGQKGWMDVGRDDSIRDEWAA